MGTPDFSVPILQKLISSAYEVVLIVTQPDRPKGRRRTLTPSPVKNEAEKHQIPVFQPDKLSENYEEILTYEPDLIVTAAYGQLLPKQLLDYPPFGCINVHASLLPKLRGGAPIHYAILQGHSKTGITIMYMAEKLDAGDILTQQEIPIQVEDHVGTLHDKLSQIGADLLLTTLPDLFANNITPQQQNDEDVTFAPNITREQEKIDWSHDSYEIYNHVRGLHPWPVAYTTYEQTQMKIWWTQMDEQHYEGVPGEIVNIADDYFTVVCGNNKGIRVMNIQPAGSRKMSVAEYLRGSKDRIILGAVMGG